MAELTPQKTDRNREMFELRFGKLEKTLQAIAEEYDITRERVNQIVSVMADRLFDRWIVDGKSTDQLAKELNVSEEAVKNAIVSVKGLTPKKK